MALLFLASMTVAGGALIASKVIKGKPGGARLYLQRKNIQISHKLGLLDDLQAAGAYEDLRRYYAKLVPSKPLVLAEPVATAKVKTIYYTGPFRSEMTRYEARLVMGVTEAQAKDLKMITKKWRGMMLKNHPDTGGSPFVAAKINEAKEILAGEKPAKEGGEDDEEDGSSALDEDETPEMKREREKKKRAKDDPYDATTPKPPPDIDSNQPPKFYTWEREPVEEPVEQTSPTSLWNLKEDLFHRKATRTDPLFKPWDDPGFAPVENWKIQYLKDIDALEKMGKEIDKRNITMEQVMSSTRSEEHEQHSTPEQSMFKQNDKQYHPDHFTHNEERRMAARARHHRAYRNFFNEEARKDRVRRVREMAEVQARARRAAERLKKKMQSGTI